MTFYNFAGYRLKFRTFTSTLLILLITVNLTRQCDRVLAFEQIPRVIYYTQAVMDRSIYLFLLFIYIYV